MARNVYTVGPAGSQAEFESIQDAIDQAVLDGHDGANRAVVEVFPGIYVEDVAMAAGVNVFGTSAAMVDGTVTVDLAPQADPDDTTVTWRQVSIAPTGGGPAIHFTGTAYQSMILVETILRGTAGTEVILVDNSGDDMGDASLMAVVQCTIEGEGVGLVLLRQLSATVFSILSQYMHLDVAETAMVIDGTVGGATKLMTAVSVGGLVVTDSAVVFGRRVSYEAAGASAIDMTASFYINEGYTVINCDTSPVVTGTGLFVFDLVAFTLGGGTGYAGVTPFRFPVDGALNIQYEAAVPADWGGSSPANVAEALDRIAAALGPIP